MSAQVWAGHVCLCIQVDVLHVYLLCTHLQCSMLYRYATCISHYMYMYGRVHVYLHAVSAVWWFNLCMYTFGSLLIFVVINS